MGRSPKSLINETFGSLIVVGLVSRNNHGNSRWLCQCECGNKTEVYYQNLTSGSVQSCGCLPKGRKSGSKNKNKQ
jgi:hypothetical protein